MPQSYFLKMSAIAFIIFLTTILVARQFLLSSQRIKADTLTLPLQRRFEATKANLEGNTTRTQALSELSSLRGDVQTLLKDTGQSRVAHQRFLVLLAQVERAYDQYSGERTVLALPVYYDFRLISSDMVPIAVDFDVEGKLAVFADGTRSRLVSVSLENKQPQVLSLEGTEQKLIDVVVAKRKAYVLHKAGINEISLPLDQLGRTLEQSEGNWSEPRALGVYQENVYMLDTVKRQILKYDLTNPTASPSSWFRSKEGLDFDSLTGMTIDGDVWLTTSKGGIFHFSKGVRVPFTPTGLVQAFKGSLSLYTREGINSLYVLEPQAARLVVLSKDGVFQSSVASKDFMTASKLIVNEETKKAYVLAGSIVYEVNLQ